LSISVIAGLQGVVASPISAATVAMIGNLAGREVSLPALLAITVPSTFLGVLCGALAVAWRGPDLNEDPEYQKRLATGITKPPAELPRLKGRTLFNARGSTLLFLAGITAVIAIGMFPDLRPTYEIESLGAMATDQVDMGAAIMIVMLAVAGLTMVLFQASPEDAMKGAIMRSGITAVICIVGVSWLGSSFFEGNRTVIVSGIAILIEHHPWTFALGLFVLSSLLFSAAATVVILMPVGVALGMSTATLVAFYPAANAVFFLPTYGTLLAAVSFDQTGTTKIGRYLLNHSFMLPGLVSTISAILVGLLLGALFPSLFA
jgi:anaerobic C4-dicarboxylate transporter-like protein